jgi:hypothetical protein
MNNLGAWVVTIYDFTKRYGDVPLEALNKLRRAGVLRWDFREGKAEMTLPLGEEAFRAAYAVLLLESGK